MELLERDQLLESLRAMLARAASGGVMAMLGGEAGVGKSTLVRSFCGNHAGTPAFWGACDALSTPRPLGPLRDIARGAGGELARLIEADMPRHAIFGTFLDLLSPAGGAALAVFEDAHWADEATLDLLVFLGRRVTQTRSLVLVTFREDEVGPSHPLRRVLGDLATAQSVQRISVPPLSRAAVAALAGPAGLDADRLYDVTGGNGFFVTEVLGAPGGTVPPTVRDAVLARAARLSPSGRATLDAAAIMPEGAGLSALCATGAQPAGVDECQHSGMLRADGTVVRFRHELARLAVEQALPAAARVRLHQLALDHLAGQPGVDLARLAYHAEEAQDRTAVTEYAPGAARLAAGLGAHREAAAQYARAVRFGNELPMPRRAELLECYADECRASGRVVDAIEASARALAIWQQLGDQERYGARLAQHAYFLWNAGRNAEAYELAGAAVRLLESLPPGPALATAYSYLGYLRMLGRDMANAIDAGRRGIALAEAHDQPVLLARALNTVGTAQWFVQPDQAESTLKRSLAVARKTGNDDAAAAALCNLGTGAAEVRHYAVADRWLAESIDWCIERDLDLYRFYTLAWLARAHFEQGRWPAAARLAEGVLAAGCEYVPTQIVALTVVGRLRARRGDPDPQTPLRQAWELASHTGDLTRLWPVAAGLAEAAWLAGEGERVPALVAETLALAERLEHEWAVGELAYWQWRAGGHHQPPAPVAAGPSRGAGPYVAQMRGDSRKAAELWQTVGCPYEAAVALAESGAPDHLLAAAKQLSRLGGWAAMQQLNRQLRQAGVRNVPRRPRRPRRTTMAHPAGLTTREMEVLDLLRADLRDADIAARLHISPRTVGHHVSAILAKLGVSSRREAVKAATTLT